jgi:MoaA/NifB/PqqE/SkfB family radical SAM enzyme
METNPKIVAWEITRRCGLRCQHCRGAARDIDYSGEFSTHECFQTLDVLAAFSRPMIILTGGEPLSRPDLFEVARYAAEQGCRVVLATCGHLLTADTVARLQASGVMAVSVSLDAAKAEAHDAFRGVPGAFEKTRAGLAQLTAAGLPFQINTTVSRWNVADLPALLQQAIELGAAAIDFFFLVPTGRGSALASLALSPTERDSALAWIAAQAPTAPLRVRTTCAPQYKRFLPEGSAPFHGCMGGRGFVFISHTGQLQPCGFLDLSCGDLRAAGFDFATLYREAEVFKNLRALNPFAGCPARARARCGDYLGQEDA